ncbi:MAG: cytochrome c [bacterium]|nr:cytochrome c [bacterium]MDE0667525.1 cytochrome c [bacterium]
MTEVPEYLLERSRQRRLELTGEGGEAPAAGAPAAASAATASSPPAAAPARSTLPAVPPAAPPPPPPPPKPWVQAALARNKIPYWVMPVLLFLPIWAFMYIGTLDEPTRAATGIVADGQALYAAQCAVCHVASGAGGGTGPRLNDGEVLLTFPDDAENLGLAQHMAWVAVATDGTGEGNPYGAPERGRTAGWFANMPGHYDELTGTEILAVVLYERIAHGESDVAATLAPLIDELLAAGTLELPEQFDENTTPSDVAEFLAPLLAAGDGA